MESEEMAYGKSVSELQSNVVVSGSNVTGTLHYVTGYTGFNGSDPTEQEGNFLALDFSSNQWPVTVELVGGKKGPVSLTSDDHFCVFKIANKDTQMISVNDDLLYDLSGLTLESEE